MLVTTFGTGEASNCSQLLASCLWRQRALANHNVFHWSKISSGIRLLHELCSPCGDGLSIHLFPFRSHFGSIQVQHSSQTDSWGRPRVVVALLVLSCNELSHLQGMRLFKRLDARTVEGVGPIRQ